MNRDKIAELTGGNIRFDDFIQFDDVPIVTPSGELLDLGLSAIVCRLLRWFSSFIASSVFGYVVVWPFF
jgi:hypothetical protein